MKCHPGEFLRLLSDQTRLRSLVMLLEEGELCVCELTYALGEIQPKISRHLSALRDARVVLDLRVGQWIYYRLNPELPDWAMNILKAALDGMKQNKQYSKDIRRLKSMPRRPQNRICA